MGNHTETVKTLPLGMFTISLEVLTNNWRSVQPFFRRCVIIAAEPDPKKGWVMYQAISDDFQPWPMDRMPPMYQTSVMCPEKKLPDGRKVPDFDRAVYQFVPESLIVAPLKAASIGDIRGRARESLEDAIERMEPPSPSGPVRCGCGHAPKLYPYVAGLFRVECEACESYGEACETESEAIAKWNSDREVE